MWSSAKNTLVLGPLLFSFIVYTPRTSELLLPRGNSHHVYNAIPDTIIAHFFQVRDGLKSDLGHLRRVLRYPYVGCEASTYSARELGQWPPTRTERALGEPSRMREVFQDDIRRLAAVAFVCALSLVSISVIGVPPEHQRWYPIMASPFFLLMAFGFMESRRVELDGDKGEIVERKTSWNDWKGSERRIAFDDCHAIVIGGSTQPTKGSPFRRVWLELDEGDPVLLSTIPRGGIAKAREAAQKAQRIVGIEVQETNRKFPDDLK